MRRSYEPSRPSARTCCFFSSFKTLAMPTEPTSLRGNQCPGRHFSLAGFQVILIGRFWVIAEGPGPVLPDDHLGQMDASWSPDGNSMVFGRRGHAPHEVCGVPQRDSPRLAEGCPINLDVSELARYLARPEWSQRPRTQCSLDWVTPRGRKRLTRSNQVAPWILHRYRLPETQ